MAAEDGKEIVMRFGGNPKALEWVRGNMKKRLESEEEKKQKIYQRE